MSHTPRPWRVVESSIDGAFAYDIEADDLTIALVYPSDEMEANARLMVAAPELVDALTLAERSLGAMLGLVQVLRGKHALQPSQAAEQIRALDALNTARAAIKKVKGEA